MKISKNQFLEFSIDQRISALEILGMFLAFRKSGENTILLYGMPGSFYVEIIQTEPGNISKVEIITDDETVDLYLQHLSLEISSALH